MMTMGDSENQSFTGGLHHLCMKNWFTDATTSSLWVRIYTALFMPRDHFTEVTQQFSQSLFSGGPFLAPNDRIMIGFGTARDVKVPFAVHDMFADETGRLNLKFNVQDKVLVDTTYIFLSTPYRIDGTRRDEPQVRAFLDQVSGLIAIHTGLNFMREIVFDGEVAAADGRFSVPGKGIKMPQFAEGPFLNQAIGTAIGEIASTVAAADTDKQNRLLLALRLMDTGMRQLHGFLEYWTAFEVVCAGGSNKIKSVLSTIYGIRNHNEVARQTRFDILSRWRHEYIHKGIKPPLTASVERYIQLMFLDLLRHELGLPPNRYISAIQRAEHYDLSPLGLENRESSA
jgi:hypothetical protein